MTVPKDRPGGDRLAARRAAAQAAHDAAVVAGEACYVDPDSGFVVFTDAYLRARGTCCGSGCRHCPY